MPAARSNCWRILSFAPDGRFLLTFDNHNSVNGIREFAQRNGATVTYAPVVPPDLRIDGARLGASLDQTNLDKDNLFAYPAQSNFSGVQHDLDWIERAQGKGWDVLLDGGFCTHEPPRPASIQTGFCVVIVLQNLRLSHRYWHVACS
jgi:selenocysteine lyase/cysteine desulfurase